MVALVTDAAVVMRMMMRVMMMMIVGRRGETDGRGRHAHGAVDER